MGRKLYLPGEIRKKWRLANKNTKRSLEVWKQGGQVLHKKQTELLVHYWELGTLPQDPWDAVIITLYKNKGEKSNYSNYHRITLLSIAGKIMARVLLNRQIPEIAQDQLIEALQSWCLQEKGREQNKGHYVTFDDLSKAFDTMSREGIWRIMEKLGCQPNSWIWLSNCIKISEVKDNFIQISHSQSCFQSPIEWSRTESWLQLSSLSL